ncbi:tumor necrosis factor receptor superfamily member 25 [Struthio camelus]|uniref:tumor necrosis factor receptor superfamily member 25 n=1 Tax=Struthio camelus TaxID=8801 RepID=UPI003603E4B5
MKRGVSGAAWVLLAALWLAASGSRPGGGRDCAPAGQPRGPAPQPARPRRHAAGAACPAGTRWNETARRCCARCPAGTFLRSPCTSRGNDSVCEACPAGTFLSQPNTAPECQACYECDRHAFQSVLRNCSATSNVVCGCEPGRFRHCVDEHCSNFACRECRSCPETLVQRPCSATQDTLCSSCKPDFYAEGGKCRPCPTQAAQTCGEECQRECGGSRGQGLEYILLGLTGPLFLGALAIYHKRMRLRQDASACSPLPAALRPGPLPGPGPSSAPGGAASAPAEEAAPRSQAPASAPGVTRSGLESQALLQRCPPERAAGPAAPSALPAPCPAGPPRGAPLQGARLYAVIDAVPLRRWKEFMRLLELRDAEIEVVEMEFAHVRDQQYEMLKRWCQQTSATLDRVFTTLERMELAGCAEVLRLRLQACP